MNNSIIKIISILVQRMLQENEVFEEEELVQDLINLGYNIEDIDQAFELIFSSKEIIEGDEITAVKNPYNRVFTLAERIYLPIDLRGLIRRLIMLNVLSSGENELLITKIIQNIYNGSAKIEDLWLILEEIIEDNYKLELILKEIPEFKNHIHKDYKYIN